MFVPARLLIAHTHALGTHRDLTDYHELSRMFGSQAVTDQFESLKGVASLHLVSPENLSVLMREGALSRIPREDLLAFVRLRSDFKSQWVGKYV